MAQTYRIRPLAWAEDRFPDGKHIDTRRRLTCESVIGLLMLTFESVRPDGLWTFHHIGRSPKRLPKGTDEAGARAFVEAYYLTLLLPALEPADEMGGEWAGLVELPEG